MDDGRAIGVASTEPSDRGHDERDDRRGKDHRRHCGPTGGERPLVSADRQPVSATVSPAYTTYR